VARDVFDQPLGRVTYVRLVKGKIENVGKARWHFDVSHPKREDLDALTP
jgi:hypothetical protein